MNGFEIADASVIGHSHRRLGKNCQDAIHVIDRGDRLVAVVADGCGSSMFSEVGATIGARALACALDVYKPDVQLLLDLHATKMDFRFRSMALMMGAHTQEAIREIVSEYFMYTLVGVVMDEERTTIFALGDGIVGLNGKIESWDYPGNAPPFLGYLTASGMQPEWKIIHDGFTSEIENLLIGTDGVCYLRDAAGKPFPRDQQTEIPALEEIVWDDAFFKNSSALTRYLALVNEDIVRIGGGELDKRQGHLYDDTTLFVARRVRD